MTRYSPRTGLPTTYQVGPYDSAHLYLQWGGKLPGNEQWSCGIRLRKKVAPITQGGDPSSMIAAAATAVSAYHQRADTNINQNAKLSFVKLNAITTAGTYMNPVTFETALADLSGGRTTPLPPNQIALAVTLQTGFSRGPAHSGRIFLPLPTLVVGAAGAIPSSDAAVVGTSTDTLISDLNAIDSGYEVAIFSRKDGAPGNRRVTGCTVGLILDTQRRRRRSLAELYV